MGSGYHRDKVGRIPRNISVIARPQAARLVVSDEKPFSSQFPIASTLACRQRGEKRAIEIDADAKLPASDGFNHLAFEGSGDI